MQETSDDVESVEGKGYCDATGRQRSSTRRWREQLAIVDRDEVDWKLYEPEPEEGEHVVAEGRCACCGITKKETFIVGRASMLFWNRAGKVPNPVRWCRPCVTQGRRDDLLRHYGTETQDPRQHEWVKSDRIKMDESSQEQRGGIQGPRAGATVGSGA